MSSLNTSPSAGNTVVDKLKTYEGGTGQTTAGAALAALSGVSSALINQPSGIAGLDANKKLSAAVLPVDNLSVISVQGPSSVYKSSTTNYTITNFDVFATYTLTATNGTISRVNDVITFVASSVPGAGGFTLNGRVFSVTVADFSPSTPTVTAVDAGGVGTNVIGNFTGSAFVMNGNSDTHLNSDWQIASDSAFSNVVRSTLADAVNKTSWTVSDLAKSTTYYIRVRYRSSSGLISAWSNTLTLTTKASYIPQNELTKVQASDRNASSNNGYSVSLSYDGTRMAVGAPGTTVGGFTAVGAVYIYKRTGSSWALEQKLTQTTVVAANANDNFGFDVSLAGDATRIAIGAPNNNTTATDAGVVYVFARNTTTNVWAQEQVMGPVSPAANGCFGYSVAMDGTGTRFVAGRPANDGAGGFTATRAYVFTRTSTTWAVEQTFATTNNFGSNIGWSVSIDSAGQRVAIGVPIEWDNGQVNSTGNVYIWVRATTTWTLEQKIGSPRGSVAGPNNDRFGSAVGISKDGTRLIIGASLDASGASNTGAAYTALRATSTWTLSGTPLNATVNAQQFGTSVAINNDGSMVAVSLGTQSVGQQGTAYLFQLSGSTYTRVASVQCSDKATTGLNNGFAFQGLDLDQYAATLACGAHLDSAGSISAGGATYIYTP